MDRTIRATSLGRRIAVPSVASEPDTLHRVRRAGRNRHLEPEPRRFRFRSGICRTTPAHGPSFQFSCKKTRTTGGGPRAPLTDTLSAYPTVQCSPLLALENSSMRSFCSASPSPLIIKLSAVSPALDMPISSSICIQCRHSTSIRQPDIGIAAIFGSPAWSRWAWRGQDAVLSGRLENRCTRRYWSYWLQQSVSSDLNSTQEGRSFQHRYPATIRLVDAPRAIELVRVW